MGLRTESLLAIATASALAPLSAAQGTLPLEGGFHFVELEAGFSDCFGPGSHEVGGGVGRIDFAASGLFSGSIERRDVCENGALQDGVFPISGAHSHDALGRLVIDTNPAAPGTQVQELWLRFDHELLLIGDSSDEFPSLGLGARRASAATAGLLNGSYAYVRLAYAQQPAGLVTASEGGVLTFDGSGAYSLSGLQHSVTNGVTADLPRSASGTYAVATDGALVLAPGAETGFVSPDGELVAWFERNGAEVALTLGVRRPASFTGGALLGPYDARALGAEPGDPLVEALFSASSGVSTLDGVAGSFAFLGDDLESTPAGTAATPATESGSLTVAPDGSLALTPAGTGAAQLGGASADASLAIAAVLSEPGRVQVLTLVRKLVDATSYGLGTAGSGTVVPTIAAAGGLPFVGNSGFRLEVSGVLGGGLVLFALSEGPALGLPFLGGSLWIDPAQILLVNSATASGAPGAPGAGSASLALPIPATPGFVGLDLYAQGLTIDAGAPLGFGFTDALAFQPW
ncbi:MAG: hypothetical protein AAFZ65_04945 [Planctomycetota bacterium]